MDFKQKVQSMKFSEIMQAMITGLQNEHIKIDMVTYGSSDNGVCYGCAATNAICEISGKVFNSDTIEHGDIRAKFIDTDYVFLYKFERAINALRNGFQYSYEGYRSDINIARIPVEFERDIYDLPMLDNDNYIEDLPEYQKVCDKIKEAGY